MSVVLVQSKVSNQSALSNGSTLAYPSNVTAGNTLIFMVSWYYGCFPTITDSQSNTWTRKSLTILSGQGYGVFTAVAGSSAACTLTFAAGCGNDDLNVLAEVSGLASNPFDVVSTPTKSTSSPVVSAGALTPSVNGEYIIALFSKNGPTTYTVASPFTLEQTTSTGNPMAFEDYIQPTAGSITPTINATGVSASYFALGFAASFKPAATASVNSNFLAFM